MSMRKTRQVREAIGDPVKYYTEKAEYLQNAAEHLARALDWISEVQELDLQTPAGGDEDVNDLWDLIDEAESMASGLKDAVSAMVDMGMEG